MPLLVLTETEVAELLAMDECIELMEQALADLARGRIHQPLRSVVRPPDARGLLGLMPAHRAGPAAAYGLKAVCVFPGNATRGLDTHQGAVVLFDGETGQTQAVMNASAITAIRTAAVSAVATRALAREDARELAVLGAGVQGRSHLEAMAAVRPLERARVWSRTAARAQELARELDQRYSFPVEPVETAEAAVRDADVVVTATASSEPILERRWLKAGTHVNAVGASLPTARELDTATIVASSLFVDRTESALNEAGDYLIPAGEGAVGPDHIRAEVGDVLVGAAEGRTAADELTVFKSLGLAAEDLAAAEYLYRRAAETGTGTSVRF